MRPYASSQERRVQHRPYRDTRTTFRGLRARSTPAAAGAFRRSYYGRTVRPADRRAPLTWSAVPIDYDIRIRAVRRRAVESGPSRSGVHRAGGPRRPLTAIRHAEASGRFRVI